VPLNPLNWPAGPFLLLYAMLIPAAALMGWRLVVSGRPCGTPAEITDPEELAVLAHGPARLAEYNVAALMAGDRADVSGNRIRLRPAARASAPFRDGASWREVFAAYRRHAGGLERRLAQRGLLLDAGGLAALRRRAVGPLAVVLLFGTVRMVLAFIRDRPAGWLGLMMLAAALLAAAGRTILDRRTLSGRHALADAEARHERLRRAPTRAETPLAVALFGTPVLIGSSLGSFHDMRRDAGSGSGDGGCGSDGGGSDGGGGCGSGGCGGCGGD